MTRDFIVDARCLQDRGFAQRGVGSHTMSLLSGGLAMPEVRTAFRFVALADRTLPDLLPDHRLLFAELRNVAYDTGLTAPVLFSPSPMTHDPFFVARLQGRPGGIGVALVHDFIPHDQPDRYLRSVSERIAYYARLARLRHYDALFPNSEYTRGRLEAVVPNVPSLIVVTGVALRDTMCTSIGDPTEDRRFILLPSGDDWRKNPEVVVLAHAASRVLQLMRVPLVVTGLHDLNRQRALRDIAARRGGRSDLLQFIPFIDDATLCRLYKESLTVVVPSRIEGFSIPVIEAGSQGATVIASDCAAHCELVPDENDRFGPDDDARLRTLLDEAWEGGAIQEARRRRQTGIWERFRPERVCERFWNGVLATCEARSPKDLPRVHSAAGHRPSLAFLTPMPPSPSGCAEYSAATLTSLARHARITLFSGTDQPAAPAGVTHAGLPIRLAHLASNFDAVVSVLGNSHFHKREFDLLLEHGAACIAHDARMLDFYYHLLGPMRACEVASAEIGRPVAVQEIEAWLGDPRQLPVLFLSEIASASRPLLVHSPITAKLVQQLYGQSSTVLPFVPYRTFNDTELSPDARLQARARLGIPEGRFVVATFGAVAPDRAPGELVWAIEQLRAWGFDAQLAFVGEASSAAQLLSAAICEADVAPYVLLVPNSRDDSVYRDWLVGADAGVQLRTYGLGGLSGALLDCIAAGLPTVTNQHLATAMSAPDYVAPIPDALSAVRLAEELANIIEKSGYGYRPLDQRRELLKAQNFDNYGQQLLAALGF